QQIGRGKVPFNLPWLACSSQPYCCTSLCCRKGTITSPLPNVSDPAFRKNSRSFPIVDPEATGASWASTGVATGAAKAGAAGGGVGGETSPHKRACRARPRKKTEAPPQPAKPGKKRRGLGQPPFPPGFPSRFPGADSRSGG